MSRSFTIRKNKDIYLDNKNNKLYSQSIHQNLFLVGEMGSEYFSNLFNKLSKDINALKYDYDLISFYDELKQKNELEKIIQEYVSFIHDKIEEFLIKVNNFEKNSYYGIDLNSMNQIYNDFYQNKDYDGAIFAFLHDSLHEIIKPGSSSNFVNFEQRDKKNIPMTEWAGEDIPAYLTDKTYISGIIHFIEIELARASKEYLINTVLPNIKEELNNLNTIEEREPLQNRILGIERIKDGELAPETSYNYILMQRIKFVEATSIFNIAKNNILSETTKQTLSNMHLKIINNYLNEFENSLKTFSGSNDISFFNLNNEVSRNLNIASEVISPTKREVIDPTQRGIRNPKKIERIERSVGTQVDKPWSKESPITEKQAMIIRLYYHVLNKTIDEARNKVRDKIKINYPSFSAF